MFNAHNEQVRAHKGQPWLHPKLLQATMAKSRLLGASPANRTDEANKTAEEAFLAVLFIVMADKGRYGKAKIKKDFILGTDSYPVTVNEAYAYLKHYQPKKAGGESPATAEERAESRRRGGRVSAQKARLRRVQYHSCGLWAQGASCISMPQCDKNTQRGGGL